MIKKCAALEGEHFWRLLGRSGGLLGRSWGGLGASRAALGGVLGRLGRLLGRLGGDAKQHPDDRPRKTEFQTLLGGHHPNFGGSFWEPKSVNMASKTSPNLRRFSRAKKLLFKSLLEPSWADLGPLRPPKSCCGPHGARFLKNYIFANNRTWKPNLASNRAKMIPRWLPKRPQIYIKSMSTNYKNFDRKNNEI